MIRSARIGSVLCWLLVLALAVPSWAENEGLDDLDKATQLKVTAEDFQDLNKVVDHLDTALEKGLDEENKEFAEQLLNSTLVQRGTMAAGALMNMIQQDPQRGLRNLQLRQSAISDLQRVVGSDPKVWDAQLLIGRLNSLPLGDSHAAKRALSVVADADDAPPAQQAEALALRSQLQRNPEQQLKDLTRAIEIQPELPTFLRLRAQHLLGQKKFDEALADVDGALKLQPEDPATNELRGMILLGLSRYDDALESFNKAGELAPDSAIPYQHRGELYRQKGDLEKAVEQLTQSLEKSPDNVTTLLVRAGVYFELQKPDQALADVDQAIRIQPQLSEPYRMRIEILAATNRLPEAITELEKLISLAPDQPSLISRLGSLYFVANQPQKAIETLSKAIDLDPEDEVAVRLRADAYLSTGQHAEAIHDFAELLQKSEKDANLLNNFAWVLATSPDDKLRDGTRALEMATNACELTGYESPTILSTLAAAYAEQGDFDNAKKWSAKAVELSQQELEAATTDENRARLKTEGEQLKKELGNYEEGKPVRERQSVEDAKQESDTDPDAAPSAPAAPARTADF